jgi:hypothetical protein
VPTVAEDVIEGLGHTMAGLGHRHRPVSPGHRRPQRPDRAAAEPAGERGPPWREPTSTSTPRRSARPWCASRSTTTDRDPQRRPGPRLRALLPGRERPRDRPRAGDLPLRGRAARRRDRLADAPRAAPASGSPCRPPDRGGPPSGSSVRPSPRARPRRRRPRTSAAPRSWHRTATSVTTGRRGSQPKTSPGSAGSTARPTTTAATRGASRSLRPSGHADRDDHPDQAEHPIDHHSVVCPTPRPRPAAAAARGRAAAAGRRPGRAPAGSPLTRSFTRRPRRGARACLTAGLRGALGLEALEIAAAVVDVGHRVGHGGCPACSPISRCISCTTRRYCGVALRGGAQLQHLHRRPGVELHRVAHPVGEAHGVLRLGGMVRPAVASSCAERSSASCQRSTTPASSSSGGVS